MRPNRPLRPDFRGNRGGSAAASCAPYSLPLTSVSGSTGIAAAHRASGRQPTPPDSTQSTRQPIGPAEVDRTDAQGESRREKPEGRFGARWPGSRPVLACGRQVAALTRVMGDHHDGVEAGMGRAGRDPGRPAKDCSRARQRRCGFRRRGSRFASGTARSRSRRTRS